MQTRVVGIDLGVTAAHQAVILDLATNQHLSKPWRLRALPPDLDRLLARARQGVEGAVRVVVVLEATGMAWYPVGVYLHDRGAEVHRINGRQTRDLRKVLAKYAGCDRIDCRVLTKIYVVASDYLDPWWPPSGDQLALQRLCREYARWRDLDVAIQNRLHAYDHWTWGGWTRLIPAIAHEWVRYHWYDPWRVHSAGVAALTAAWQASMSQHKEEVGWIPGWVQRAQQMTQLYATPARVGYADLEAGLVRQLALLAQSRQAREMLSRTRIQPLYRQLYPNRWLETIHGIGCNSAAIYMAFIQDIARFLTVAHFRSWCGVVPASKQSGGRESKGLHMTQAGPDLIKATLYLNADVARQWDVQLAALYYRQIVDYGKHHTQAVCACASHLASRIYALLTEQRPYELRDLEGHPITVEESRHLCQTQYRVPPDVRQRTAVRARREREAQRTEERFTQRQRS